MYAYMHIYTIHTCHVWHHRIHMNWINTNLYLSRLLNLTTLSLYLYIYYIYIYMTYISASLAAEVHPQRATAFGVLAADRRCARRPSARACHGTVGRGAGERGDRDAGGAGRGKLGERLPPGALGDFGAMKSGRKWGIWRELAWMLGKWHWMRKNSLSLSALGGSPASKICVFMDLIVKLRSTHRNPWLSLIDPPYQYQVHLQDRAGTSCCVVNQYTHFLSIISLSAFGICFLMCSPSFLVVLFSH